MQIIYFDNPAIEGYFILFILFCLGHVEGDDV